MNMSHDHNHQISNYNHAYAIGVVIINTINNSQPEAKAEGTVGIGGKIHGNVKTH
jgi:hypothetical protein